MKTYITSDAKIMSGAPVIAGTRVPVARIVYLLKDGFTMATASLTKIVAVDLVVILQNLRADPPILIY